MKTLALTIGDPDGIGPEITARFLHRWAKDALNSPPWEGWQAEPDGVVSSWANDSLQKARLIVYGDIAALRHMANVLNISLPKPSIQLQYRNIEIGTFLDTDGTTPSGSACHPSHGGEFKGAKDTYIEADQNDISPLARCGYVAYNSLVAAVLAIRKGEADALLTGPISKENLHAANIPYEGHTEILQDLANQHFSNTASQNEIPPILNPVPTRKPSRATAEESPAEGGGDKCLDIALEQPYQSDMLFLYQQFRMLLLTRHVPLSKVGESMTYEGVCQSLKTLCEFLTEQAKIPHPKIAMLGVNPHAGESMGKGQQHESTEEARILIPAIQTIQRLFPSVALTPPLAADGAFRGFKVDHPSYDAYVAAYHDQGLIPFKMMAGLQAVNVTIGLPFLRTSVSHGTAPDIAGKGIASEESLIAAYQAALELMKK